jgi:hypothetical protein
MANFEIKKNYFMLLVIKFHILMYIDSSDPCTAQVVISSYPVHMYPQYKTFFVWKFFVLSVFRSEFHVIKYWDSDLLYCPA